MIPSVIQKNQGSRMLLFFGENSEHGPKTRVQGEYIGDVYDVIADEVTYELSGGADEGMLVTIRRDNDTELWGIEIRQVSYEARIPWPTFLRMDESGSSVVLEVEVPKSVEVKVVSG